MLLYVENGRFLCNINKLHKKSSTFVSEISQNLLENW